MTSLHDTLCNLVSNKANVTLVFISHPEMIVSGILTNFELVDRTYTVLVKPSGKLFIVNMDDVSMLEVTD